MDWPAYHTQSNSPASSHYPTSRLYRSIWNSTSTKLKNKKKPSRTVIRAELSDRAACAASTMATQRGAALILHYARYLPAVQFNHTFTFILNRFAICGVSYTRTIREYKPRTFQFPPIFFFVCFYFIFNSHRCTNIRHTMLIFMMYFMLLIMKTLQKMVKKM